jgi:hypothetical protein
VTESPRPGSPWTWFVASLARRPGRLTGDPVPRPGYGVSCVQRVSEIGWVRAWGGGLGFTRWWSLF